MRAARIAPNVAPNDIIAPDDVQAPDILVPDGKQIHPQAWKDLSKVERKVMAYLASQPNGWATIEHIQPNPKTSPRERERICLRLFEQDLLDYAYRVTQFAIAPPGRLLLNLQTTSLPLTPSEYWTLQACRVSSSAPERLAKVPETDRQRIIRQLADRRLLIIKQRRLSAVWLTLRGQQCLAAEGSLDRPVAALSCREMVAVTSTAPATLTDQLLAMLTWCEPRWGTTEGVPIFRLRAQLQSIMTTDQFEDCLRQLWQAQQIELTPLQQIEPYSDQQIAAGLRPQTGSQRWPAFPWFFVIRG